MSVRFGQRPGRRPRRYLGTPLPETERRLRPEDVLRGFVLGVVILVLGFVLGQFTFDQIHGRGTAYFILAAAIGVAVTWISYRKLELAMAALIVVTWVGVGNTPSVATGMTSGGGQGVTIAQVGPAFLLLIWLVRGVAQGQLVFLRSPMNGLLTLYLAWCVLSAVNGGIFWDPAVAHFWGPALNGGREPLLGTTVEIGMRVLCVGVFWVFANNVSDAAWLRRMSWLLLLPGAVIFLGIASHTFVPQQGYTPLLIGVVDTALFAWLLEPIAPDAPRRRGLRALGWAVLALIIVLIGIMALHWVSAGLNLLVGLFFVAFLRNKRLFFGMLVSGIVLYFAGHAFLEATVIHKVRVGGDLARFSMAHAAVLYALKFPLGVGPGNYRAYNIYYGSPDVWNTSTFTSAHGFYSQMLSELGFGGFFIVLAFMITPLVMMARFYRQLAAGETRTWMLALGGMWAGAAGATAIGDYVIPIYHNGGIHTMSSAVYFWIGLGLAFAHARHAGLLSERKKQRPEASVPPIADYYPRRMTREPTH